jgi:hypothetical protein
MHVGVFSGMTVCVIRLQMEKLMVKVVISLVVLVWWKL